MQKPTVQYWGESDDGELCFPLTVDEQAWILGTLKGAVIGAAKIYGDLYVVHVCLVIDVDNRSVSVSLANELAATADSDNDAELAAYLRDYPAGDVATVLLKGGDRLLITGFEIIDEFKQGRLS